MLWLNAGHERAREGVAKNDRFSERVQHVLELVSTLRNLRKDGKRGRRQISPSAEPPDRLPSNMGNETPFLSERQLEVLRLVARGLSNREIAERLHLSIRTIKRHVTDILKALGVPNRASAAVAALRRGLIE
jgi:DNA-binding NarL/FixJ family response regulator